MFGGSLGSVCGNTLILAVLGGCRYLALLFRVRCCIVVNYTCYTLSSTNKYEFKAESRYILDVVAYAARIQTRSTHDEGHAIVCMCMG